MRDDDRCYQNFTAYDATALVRFRNGTVAHVSSRIRLGNAGTEVAFFPVAEIRAIDCKHGSE
jgi:hypothetical protein